MARKTTTKTALKASENVLERLEENSRINRTITNENSVETNTEDYTREYLQNRIETALECYKTEYNTDIYSLSQIQWNHVLEYIFLTVIKPLKIDYRNIDVLIGLQKIYLSINRLYNKTSSIYGYAIISGIPYNTLKTYNNSKVKHNIYYDSTLNTVVDTDYINTYKVLHKGNTVIELPNDTYNLLTKNIQHDREHALTDKAENGSVMALALGKTEFGWIESAKERIQVEMMESYRLPADLINKYSDN